MIRKLYSLICFGLLGLGLAQAHNFDVLVFMPATPSSLETTALSAIQNLGFVHNFNVISSGDPADLDSANLSTYSAVIFLNRNGNGLSTQQKADFEAFIQSGNGFVGLYSAAVATSGWAWFDTLIGAYSTGSPLASQNGTLIVADRFHPSSKEVPQEWSITDAFYNLASNPRGEVHVLATLKESSISGGTNGYDHPIIWAHEFDGGRSWYCGLGGVNTVYYDSLFQNLLLGGIEWAAAAMTGDVGATIDDNYSITVLDDNVNNPMSMDIAPDGRVFYVEREGKLKIINPSTSTTKTVLNKQVFTGGENGMIGIALDPLFGDPLGTNDLVYVFYTDMRDLSGNLNFGLSGPAIQKIVRFQVIGDSVDESSEEVVLSYISMREGTHHSGGCLHFDQSGNLLISAGDNTDLNTGYAPIDERSGFEQYDAQRTAANTNDYNGKILRITPKPYGSAAPLYTCPNDNLFQPGGPASSITGLPEVYVMGTRNPFRFSVDQLTGWVYWGDVGPDAFSDDALKGPKGHDEFNQAKQAGNFGWPYILGDSMRYGDHNFTTDVTGPKFDINNLTNNSPNNTGSLTLPPATPAWIWYFDGTAPKFPELGGGGRTTAVAGPVYHYDPGNTNPGRLPEYFDKTFFIVEWSRNWIKEVKMDANGNIVKINPFLSSMSFSRPLEMKVGKDGAIYLLEWGAGWISNPDARIIKIEYSPTGRKPLAVASADKTSGPISLLVTFKGDDSYDPDGGTLTYSWDFGDGSALSSLPNPTHTFASAGVYTVTLTVSNGSGASAKTRLAVTVGNNEPVLTITTPVDGGFFEWGDVIAYQVSATDVEDGSTPSGGIICSDLEHTSILGHNDHGHPLELLTNCSGQFSTPINNGHDPEDNVYYLFQAAYTDNGAPGTGALTGATTHLINPKLKQAEHMTGSSGVLVTATSDVNGRYDVRSIDNGDYISFNPMNLLNISAITFRVAPGNGGTIEIHKGTPNGVATLLTSAIVPTGSLTSYTDITIPVTDPGGTFDYHFRFKNPLNPTNLMYLNWILFQGSGIGASLPVEMVDFRAEAMDNLYVKLSWETLREVNNEYFEVERVRVLSEDPEIVAQSPGQGNSTVRHRYEAFDNEPLPGQSYYRLVQYDFDGSSSYSNWQKVEFNLDASELGVYVYPNPVRDEVNIEFNAAAGVVNVGLYDLSGAQLRGVQRIISQNDRLKLELNLSDLAQGIYLLRVQNEEKISYQKVVVAH